MSSSSAGPQPPVDGAGASPAPSITVAGVARRLGVAPATLRTWDRRYGLGPSEHAAGAHRRYTPADVGRLETMRRLVLEGVAPADAARAALAARTTDAVVTPFPVPPPADPATPAAPAVDHSDVASGRGGGGQVVPIPGGSAAARGLSRAAMALDGPAVSAIVASNLAAHGVVATWNDLLAPVLVGIGRRYESTGRGVDVEHLLSECISTSLRVVAQQLRHPVNVRPVLLACADEEQHTLPLHAVAAGLAERGVGTRMLGGRVPRGALAAAVRRSGPLAVMVWAQVPECGAVGQLDDLPAVRPAPLVVVGGPGWPDRVPAGITRVHDLAGAIDRLATAALL